MKRYQTLMIIILITEVVYMLFLQSGSQILVHYFADNFANTVSTIYIVTIVLNIILWLPAAIWIYNDANEQPVLPLVWGLVVLILGFKGVILYIAFLILFSLKDKEIKSGNIG
jgi:hypothetical protein